MRVTLDREFDILSLSFVDNARSYGGEEYDGIVVFHDMDSDAITGIMIYDFMKRYNNHSIKNVKLPVEVDFDNDIISKICRFRNSTI